ncbi:hypothetical protein BROUX41_002393 [Berkeleyomyces rouxiae]|uniref:uncharacterized protein n=1 Tax=Berkeleyomyces rouxiae TaxID=2035830 RepID=UPI003B7F2D7E
MSISLTACALDRAAHELELLSLNPKALSLSLDCRFSQAHPPFSPYASSFTDSLSSSSDHDFSPSSDRQVYSPPAKNAGYGCYNRRMFDCFDDSDDEPQIEHFEDVADDKTEVDVDLDMDMDDAQDMPALYRCAKHNETASWINSPVQHVEHVYDTGYEDEYMYDAGYDAEYPQDYDYDYDSDANSDCTLDDGHFEFAQQHEVQAFLAQMQAHMEVKMAAQREKQEAKKDKLLAGQANQALLQKALHQGPLDTLSVS